ncbi:MAG: hypothetical protein AB8G16_18105 [Gammaproteobacteria bacterium]
MKGFLKNALVTGIPFGLMTGLLVGFLSGIGAAVFAGILGLVSFGPVMAALAASNRESMQGKLALDDGESLLKEGPASQRAGMNTRGGWMTLTNQRLHFATNQLNLSQHEWSQPLVDIAKQDATLTAWLVPNGLKITAHDETQSFVVEGRKQWVSAIVEAKSTGRV